MRNTKQKQIIADVVLSSCDHPNADTIMLRAKAIMPSINTATVYRVLGELSREGRILKIDSASGSHYDKTFYPHAHFMCERCERVLDVETADLSKKFESIEKNIGGKINSVNVLFFGVCADCIKNQN